MAATTRSSVSGRGGILLMLFGLPFFIAGCITGYMAYSMVADALAARRWVECPASIRTVRLESHRGDKSTTYEVLCAYDYTFDGRAYQGERVGLDSGSDNIGSWHEDTYQRLKAAQESGQTVPCFVNPSRPTQAVLDREVRFGLLVFILLFPAAFGGVGAGLMIGGGWWRRHARRALADHAAPVGQPWEADPRWGSGVLRPRGRAKAPVATAVALFWNAVWWPIYLFLPAELSKGNRAALIALLIPASGLALLSFAVHSILQRRRFGRSYFELHTLPGRVGGQLSGDVVVVADLANIESIEAKLACINTVTTRSGGKSSMNISTIWQEQKALSLPAITFGQAEVRLPVTFQIPDSCRPCDQTDPADKVAWRLSIRGAMRGVNLSLQFDVPVFRGGDVQRVAGTIQQQDQMEGG